MAARQLTLIGSLGKGVGGYFPQVQAAETRQSTIPLIRQQQAEFGVVREELDRQNAWMAIPVLAPEAAVSLAGLGTLAALRFAKPIPPGPLVIEKMGFRGGNSWQARAGIKANRAWNEAAKRKGWKNEPRIYDENGKELRPDHGLPKRREEWADSYVERKPNTPTGRAAGRRQAQRYRDAYPKDTDAKRKPNRVRVLHYNPEDYI